MGAENYYHADELRESIAAIVPPGQVFEIRLINAATANQPAISGYFRSVDVFLDQLRRQPLQDMNVYIVLNELPADLHSRAQRDKFIKGAKNTGDTDVKRRRWILIDCDPEHVAGISATEEEKDEAGKVMQRVRAALEENGILPSIVGFSGNGYHLLLAVDLPNTQASTDLVKRFLYALDTHFSTDKVSIDISVSNAARISKLYGSKAQKGADSPERPHRFSKMLENNGRQLVPEDALEGFMLEYPPGPMDGRDKPGKSTAPDPVTTLPPGTGATARQKAYFDLYAWCETHLPDNIRRHYEVHSDGTFNVYLNPCVFNDGHTYRDAHLWQTAEGKVFYRCWHKSCIHTHTWWDVLKKYDPELRARLLHERDEADAAELEAARENAANESVPVRLRSVAEYEQATPKWLFEPYIARGCITLLVGTGGTGKTSLWCNLAAAVSSGGQGVLARDNPNPFVDHIEPENVLYFSAEDSTEFILRRRLEDNGADVTKIWNVDPNDEGWNACKFGSKQIEECIKQIRPALVIFDPVQSFLPNKIDMAKRNHIRNALTPVAQLAAEYDCAVLIVVHTNKMANVSGRQRMADSSDLWDLARSVLMLGTTTDKDEEGNAYRYLSHEKTNIAFRTGSTIEYRVEKGACVFRCFSEKKDADYQNAETRTRTEGPAKQNAADFIKRYLVENGISGGNTKYCLLSDLEDAATAEGIRPWPLRSAKTSLGQRGVIRLWQVGYGKNKKYYIRLTQTNKPLYIDRQPTPDEAAEDARLIEEVESHAQAEIDEAIRAADPTLTEEAANAGRKSKRGRIGKKKAQNSADTEPKEGATDPAKDNKA